MAERDDEELVEPIPPIEIPIEPEPPELGEKLLAESAKELETSTGSAEWDAARRRVHELLVALSQQTAAPLAGDPMRDFHASAQRMLEVSEAMTAELEAKRKFGGHSMTAEELSKLARTSPAVARRDADVRTLRSPNALLTQSATRAYLTAG